MGFDWIIRLAIALALLPEATAAFATPSEPLVVSELPEVSLVPLANDQAEAPAQTIDDATARFSLAVTQALISDQRSAQEACRSSRPNTATDPVVRYEWQARCLYRRR